MSPVLCRSVRLSSARQKHGAKQKHVDVISTKVCSENEAKRRFIVWKDRRDQSVHCKTPFKLEKHQKLILLNELASCSLMTQMMSPRLTCVAVALFSLLKFQALAAFFLDNIWVIIIV